MSLVIKTAQQPAMRASAVRAEIRKMRASSAKNGTALGRRYRPSHSGR